MKERAKHFLLIFLVLLVLVGGISIFLNNASYNPDFSVMDAISGATKKAHYDDNNETVSAWKYTEDDLALSGENYEEEVVETSGGTYKVLKNIPLMENKDDILVLSNKENAAYQKAVQNLASDLEEQGYKVRIKECSETMMLSFAHAGHFTVFLMSEEVAQ